MTPTSSVAVRVETATVRLLDVAGIVNSVMTGAEVSKNVIVAEAEAADETLPAPSLAQA